MDVRKAFDSLWQEGLFYKFLQAGLSHSTWKIIVQLYSKPVCRVKLGQHTSSWFTAQTGIVQGAPLSMFNYQFFSNDLLRQLKNENAGARIGEFTLTCPAFADDLTIIAPSRKGLQKLIDVAYEHSVKWRYKFSPKKCAVIACGKPQPDQPFNLGPDLIEIVPAHDHVGTLLTESKKEKIRYIQKRVDTCTKPGYAALSIGTCYAPMTPISASKLYWSVCIPKLTYGLHLMDLPDEALSDMESFHAKMAKSYQGLPDQVSNVGAVATIGWLSVSRIILISLLLYFMRIIRLPATNIYKKLFINRYVYHMYHEDGIHMGPVSNFLQSCKRYGLLPIIKEAIEMCSPPDVRSWKKMVHTMVKSVENTEWRVTSGLYPTLETVANIVTKKQMLAWWELAQILPEYLKKCRTAARLMFGCARLKKPMHRQRESDDPFCDKCDAYEEEDAEHLLFRCPSNNKHRKALWNRLQMICPAQL